MIDLNPLDDIVEPIQDFILHNVVQPLDYIYEFIVDMQYVIINYISDTVLGLGANIASSIIQVLNNVGSGLNIISDVSSNLYGLVNNIIKGKLDQIINATGFIYDAIVSYISGVNQNITWWFQDLFDYLYTNVTGSINFVSNNINNLSNTITGQVNTILNILNSLVSSITTVIINAVNQAIQPVIMVLQTVLNTITGLISDLGFSLGSQIGNITAQIIDNFGFAINPLTITINAVTDTINYIKNNSLTDIISDIRDLRDDIINNVIVTVESIGTTLEDVFLNVTHALDIGLANINPMIDNLKLWIATQFSSLVAQLAIKSGATKIEVSSIVNNAVNDFERFVVDLFETVDIEIKSLWDKYRPIYMKIIHNQYTDVDQIFTDMSTFNPNAGAIGSLLQLLVIGSTVIQSLVVSSSPFAQNINTLAMTEATPSNLTLDVLARAKFKGFITYGDYLAAARKVGYDEKTAGIFHNATLPELDPSQLQILFMRDKISEIDHDKGLAKYGYDAYEISKIKELYKILPPPQDLITMAVREVFNPTLVQQYGLMEEFPSTFATYAEQQGLDLTWANYYWAAHWRLPSTEQGFEMFQRRIISEDQLKTLLKALDIMPNWRDNLIKLNYKTLTRVDVRRMHKLGVLSDNDVYYNYLDLGYSPKDAELMKKFTIEYNEGEIDQGTVQVSELSRTVILQAFDKGILSEGDTILRLEKLGFLINDIYLLIDIAKFNKKVKLTPDRKQEFINDTITLTENAYLRHTISKAEAKANFIKVGMLDIDADTKLMLLDYAYDSKIKAKVGDSIGKLYQDRIYNKKDATKQLEIGGFSQIEITAFFNENDKFLDFRGDRPSQAQLFKWVLGGDLSLVEYGNELRGMGLAEKFVVLYIKDADLALQGM